MYHNKKKSINLSYWKVFNICPEVRKKNQVFICRMRKCASLPWCCQPWCSIPAQPPAPGSACRSACAASAWLCSWAWSPAAPLSLLANLSRYGFFKDFFFSKVSVLLFILLCQRAAAFFHTICTLTNGTGWFVVAGMISCGPHLQFSSGEKWVGAPNMMICC